jgi:hypothetical protein
MKEISYIDIFSLFLKALKFDAEITRAPNGFRAKKGNSYFRLIKSSRRILLKESSVVFNGYEYEKVEKLFLYKITEDLGDIKVLDENHRAIICLQSEHSILKIETARPKAQNNVQFHGTRDLLQYKEPKTANVAAALF